MSPRGVCLSMARALRLALLLLAVGLLWQSAPRAAATPRSMDPQVRWRLEGYIFSQDGSAWQIGDHKVTVDGRTVLLEQAGAAEVGAWVITNASQIDNDPLHADLIDVQRSSQLDGITIQFSGILEKHYEDSWSVGGRFFSVTGSTRIYGEPTIGALLRVVAVQNGSLVDALFIEVVANTPDEVPVGFEGPISKIGSEQWVVDGSVVLLQIDTNIMGVAAEGKEAEVEALRSANGLLYARTIRVIEPSLDGAAGDQPEAIAARTGVAGDPAGLTLPWSLPVAVARQLPQAARPSLAYDGAEVGHAVWESAGRIMYASALPGQGWGDPVKVGTGYSPVIVADNRNDTLHVLFVNQFMGNDEVFFVQRHGSKWTLPIIVSRTTGSSQEVKLIQAADGTLHAAWQDNTPGYWTIYYGMWYGSFWSSQPVPNGRGESPALASTLDGSILLAWHDRWAYSASEAGMYDVLLAQAKDDVWSVPINVSDRPHVDSADAAITVGADGLAHVVWSDGGYEACYSYGIGATWSSPVTLYTSPYPVVKLGVVADMGQALYVAWEDGESVLITSAPTQSVGWPAPLYLTAADAYLRDVTLALLPRYGVSMAWVHTTLSGESIVFESKQGPVMTQSSWMPLVTLN